MCNDGGKRRRFDTKADAKRFLRRFGRKSQLKAYFCPDCATWRITSRRKRSKPSVKPELGAPNGQPGEPRRRVQTVVTVPPQHQQHSAKEN